MCGGGKIDGIDRGKALLEADEKVKLAEKAEEESIASNEVSWLNESCSPREIDPFMVRLKREDALNEWNNLPLIKDEADTRENLKNDNKAFDVCYKEESRWYDFNGHRIRRKCAKEKEVLSEFKQKHEDALKAKNDFIKKIDKEVPGLADYIQKNGETIEEFKNDDFATKCAKYVGVASRYIADKTLDGIDFAWSKFPGKQRGDIKNSKGVVAGIAVFASNVISPGNVLLVGGTTVLFLAVVPFVIPFSVVVGLGVPAAYTLHAMSESGVTATDVNQEVAVKSSITSTVIGVSEALVGIAIMRNDERQRNIREQQTKYRAVSRRFYNEIVMEGAQADAASRMEQDVRVVIVGVQLRREEELVEYRQREEYRVPGAIVATPDEQVTYEQGDVRDKIWPCEQCHKRHRPRTETGPYPCGSYVDEISNHRAKHLFSKGFEEIKRQRPRSNDTPAKQRQREESQRASDKQAETHVMSELKNMNRRLEDQNHRLENQNRMLKDQNEEWWGKWWNMGCNRNAILQNEGRVERNKISIEDNERYIKDNNKFMEKLAK